VSKVERLENEIRTLSTEELATFRAWFREFDADAWDREIEADVLAGKLDDLADSALYAHRAGKSTSL
jgi:hypothetical protein